MKLSEEHDLLEQATATATLASHLARFRPVTYRRYNRVKPNQQPFSNRDIPVLVSTYEPLLDDATVQADFVAYRATLSEISQHSQRIHQYDYESVPLLFDTGANVSCSFNKHDFISLVRPAQPTKIKGIASSLTVKGIGTILYHLTADDGTLVTLKIPNVLYVPDCPTRLICPRQILHHVDDPDASLTVTSSSLKLSFRGSNITIPYDEQLNIPILSTASGVQSYLYYCQVIGQSHQTPPELSLDSAFAAAGLLTPNLTPGQRVKRKLHERNCHKNYGQINQWILDGTFDCPKSVAKEPDPVCPICQFGKARRQTHKGKMGQSQPTPKPPVKACPPTRWRPTCLAYYQPQKVHQPRNATYIAIFGSTTSLTSFSLQCTKLSMRQNS